jgi:hypothetical protein
MLRIATAHCGSNFKNPSSSNPGSKTTPALQSLRAAARPIYVVGHRRHVQQPATQGQQSIGRDLGTPGYVHVLPSSAPDDLTALPINQQSCKDLRKGLYIAAGVEEARLPVPDEPGRGTGAVARDDAAG